ALMYLVRLWFVSTHNAPRCTGWLRECRPESSSSCLAAHKAMDQILKEASRCKSVSLAIAEE
ncbi:MAG: hypothetical protein WAZ77_16455, partial [Candidatus Nitrosopolaris sp.]